MAFRRKYRDDKGRLVETDNWYVDVPLPDGSCLRLPGYSDKPSTEEMGRKVQKLAATRVENQPPTPELREWLDKLSSKIRDKLAKAGLLDTRSVQSAKPLSQHVEDYRQSLQDSGATPDHVLVTCNRVRAVLEGVGAKRIADVTATGVARYLADRRAKPKAEGGLSKKSSNHYLAAAKGFFNWLVRERRAAENPVAHLNKQNAETDRRHIRRAFDLDELKQLLAVTQQGPERFGMSGEQRYWLYWLAASTGLRANEIRSLTRQSFCLNSDESSVTVDAAFAKNRRTRTVPLRTDAVAALTAFIGRKVPTAPVFTLPLATCIVRMLREDMAAARGEWLGEARTGEERQKRERSSFLQYRDEVGWVADFHSFRVTFATVLVANGTDVKTAQEGLGHATPMMTLGVYAKVRKGSLREAIEGMPSIAVTRKAAEANGTDGRAEPHWQENWQDHWQERKAQGSTSVPSRSPKSNRSDPRSQCGKPESGSDLAGSVVKGSERNRSQRGTGGDGIRTHE